MKIEKYILITGEDISTFEDSTDCIYGADGEVLFVPEELFNETYNRTSTVDTENPSYIVDMSKSGVISPIYNIGDEFSYWNFDHSKRIRIKITAIIIRKEGVYYEVEGNGWEDEFSEETIKTMYYENSNTRTSN